MFQSAGASLVAVAQILAVAILAIAEEHVSKTALVTVIGSQALVIVIVILMARRLITNGNPAAVSSSVPKFVLTAEDERTLCGLAEHPDGTYTIHLAHTIGLSKTRTDHSIDRLELVKYVTRLIDTDRGPKFRVTPEGRAYIVQSRLA